MSHAIDTIKRFYDLTPRGIIHVGANKGQEVPAYKEKAIRPIVMIEPLADQFARLVKAIDGEAGFYPVQACCASESGKTVDFHVASNSGQSSSFLKPGKHVELYPGVTFQKTIQIQTATLDEIMAALPEPVEAFDYLAADTQGAEMEVLKGASKTLEHIKYAWLEVNFGGLYEGDFDLYQITEFMRSKGFDLYYLVMRRQQWGDALYVRKGVVAPAPPAL
jgi:FkbM family methyltransferase